MSEPRVVLFDLETLPNLREALKVWPGLSNFPGTTLKGSLNSICCFGWKVFGGDKPAQVVSAWDFPEWQVDVNDDGPLLRAAYDILKSADAVITQNGKSFDEKVIRTRFLLRGMDHLPPIKHVDTKLLAKRFSFFSNSLKYLAEQLTDTRKIENEGWNLWVRTYDRDPEACRIMAEYCAGDVEALEAIYKRLRPAERGANALPNHNLFQQGGLDQRLCPTCGSSRLWFEGYRYNKTNTKKKYSCRDCGSWCTTDAGDHLPRGF